MHVGQWLKLSPGTDSQQLRALVRQARKDAKPEKPGAGVRHGRAYRDIFQLVREQLHRHRAPVPTARKTTTASQDNPGACHAPIEPSW